METQMYKLLISATAAAFLLCSGSATSFAAGTADEQRDCTGDAFSLCGQFIPNEKAITACMLKQKVKLSPACRRHFK
jgi:hypothetical protein